MKFYCGIGLSARDSHLCVIDDPQSILLQQKVNNELPRLLDPLSPLRSNLQIEEVSRRVTAWEIRRSMEAEIPEV